MTAEECGACQKHLTSSQDAINCVTIGSKNYRDLLMNKSYIGIYEEALRKYKERLKKDRNGQLFRKKYCFWSETSDNLDETNEMATLRWELQSDASTKDEKRQAIWDFFETQITDMTLTKIKTKTSFFGFFVKELMNSEPRQNWDLWTDGYLKGRRIYNTGNREDNIKLDYKNCCIAHQKMFELNGLKITVESLKVESLKVENLKVENLEVENLEVKNLEVKNEVKNLEVGSLKVKNLKEYLTGGNLYKYEASTVIGYGFNSCDEIGIRIVKVKDNEREPFWTIQKRTIEEFAYNGGSWSFCVSEKIASPEQERHHHAKFTINSKGDINAIEDLEVEYEGFARNHQLSACIIMPLTELTLESKISSKEATKAFEKIKALTNLKTLTLKMNLNDRDLDVLVNHLLDPNYPKITSLSLVGNKKLTENGMRLLACALPYTSLKQVNLSGTQVSSATTIEKACREKKPFLARLKNKPLECLLKKILPKVAEEYRAGLWSFNGMFHGGSNSRAGCNVFEVAARQPSLAIMLGLLTRYLDTYDSRMIDSSSLGVRLIKALRNVPGIELDATQSYKSQLNHINEHFKQLLSGVKTELKNRSSLQTTKR